MLLHSVTKWKFEQDTERGIPHLRDWCGKHLRAPSCFHGSVGQEWEVFFDIGVGLYIRTTKSADRTDTMASDYMGYWIDRHRFVVEKQLLPSCNDYSCFYKRIWTKTKLWKGYKYFGYDGFQKKSAVWRMEKAEQHIEIQNLGNSSISKKYLFWVIIIYGSNYFIHTDKTKHRCRRNSLKW